MLNVTIQNNSLLMHNYCSYPESKCSCRLMSPFFISKFYIVISFARYVIVLFTTKIKLDWKNGEVNFPSDTKLNVKLKLYYVHFYRLAWTGDLATLWCLILLTGWAPERRQKPLRRWEKGCPIFYIIVTQKLLTIHIASA